LLTQYLVPAHLIKREQFLVAHLFLIEPRCLKLLRLAAIQLFRALQVPHCGEVALVEGEPNN
jgi:hypothetical protein